MAPSIATAVLPLVAKIATNNDLYDMKLYRILLSALRNSRRNLLCIHFCKYSGKDCSGKNPRCANKFLDALRAVAKNKLFWVISLAG